MNNTGIHDSAKKRLFRRVIKNEALLQDCTTDKEYAKTKRRMDDWFEIVSALGLQLELKQYKKELEDLTNE